MAYDITGSVHHTGVQNECDVISFLNTTEYFPTLIKPAGGTQHKADGLINPNTGLSIKHKRSGIQKGSFDYLNTTLIPDYFKEYFLEFFEDIKQYRAELTDAQRSDESFISDVRKRFNGISKEALDAFTEDHVTSFLYDALITRYQNCPYIAIRDGVSNLLYLYKRDDNPVVFQLLRGTKFHCVGKAKGSRRIATTNLRIRLVTNNGIGALLGISNANKVSCLTLKLQQDKVPALINAVSPVIFDMGK